MSDRPAQFTDRLLAELLPLVGNTAPTPVPPSRARFEVNGAAARRRGPARPVRRRLALLGCALLLAAGGAVTASVLWPHGSPAYAVETRADGSVVVTVKDLSDPEGLQALLNANHVPATVLVIKDGQQCAPLRAVGAPGAIVGSPSASNVLTIHPQALPHGTRVVLGLGQGEQGVLTLFTVVAGPAPSCFPGSAPVPAPR